MRIVLAAVFYLVGCSIGLRSTFLFWGLQKDVYDAFGLDEFHPPRFLRVLQLHEGLYPEKILILRLLLVCGAVVAANVIFGLK